MQGLQALAEPMGRAAAAIHLGLRELQHFVLHDLPARGGAVARGAEGVPGAPGEGGSGGRR